LAEIFRKKGLDVILIDVAPNMLPGGSHPTTSSFLEEYYLQKGIDVRLGCNVDSVENTREGLVCPFPEGEEEVSFISVCAGIRPNIGFIDGSLIAVDQAILVDEKMQTNIEAVYAAGDVCQGINPLSGKQEWLPAWSNACYQGRTAGLNMAGLESFNPGNIPQHISPFFKWNYAQIGNIKCEGEGIRIISQGNPFNGSYYLLVFEKDILIGANLINCTEKAGIIRNAIMRKTKLKTHIDLKPFAYTNSFLDFIN
jgi:NADPH-dependent 2,4-dienoyl-CoA reductase/sulfur reductase-like enzyme